MANPFEELEKPKASVTPPSSAAGIGSNPFRSIEAPEARQAAPAPADDREYKPTFFGNLTDRLAGGFTLGLTDLVSKLVNPKSAENAEKFKKDHPYAALGAEIAGGIGPGIASGLALGKVIPALGKATIPSMVGNAALSGAGTTAAEDLIKDQKIDIVNILKSGVMSGAVAGVLGMGSRMLPGPKFRASGSDLTSADKAAMKELAATGDRAGIPLRVPELAAEVAPGRAAGVESLDNYVSRMKSGGIEKRNFDDARLPNLQAAVDKVKSIVGPRPETGLPAQEGAAKALNNAEKLVRNSARPDYKTAESIILPQRQDIPNIIDTRKSVYKDKVVGPAINEMNPNSIGVMQHVADALEGQIKRAGVKSGPAKKTMLIDQKRGLLTQMEKASPEFARAQATTAAGKKMVEDVTAGPLGTISKTNNPTTQARALLDAEPNASRKAVERLTAVDEALPRSILAGEVDKLGADPVTFGRKLAPTKDSERVIKQILDNPNSVPRTGPISPNAAVPPSDFDAIKDIITAARARTKASAPSAENADGPISAGWNFLQDIQGGGVARRMNDPANIDKLGEAGALQRLLNAFGVSGSGEVKAPDTPLVIDLKPRRKKKDDEPPRRGTRTASAR